MKYFSEACKRNEEPIGDVLAEVLPQEGLVLEVGSGTGQHAAAFAQRFPAVRWQPTNGPGGLESIEAWRDEVDLPNLLPPLDFNLFDDRPPVDHADAVVAINVIHIAPLEAADRLFAHAAELLDSGSPIFFYGPHPHTDQPLEPSNERFDEFLRSRDPESGIRRFDKVDEFARNHGFQHVETRRLPANNDAVWWIRE